MTLVSLQGDLKKAIATGNSEEIGRAELELVGKINKGEEKLLISTSDDIERPLNKTIHIPISSSSKNMQTFPEYKLSISDVRSICNQSFKVDRVLNADYHSQN